MIKFKWYSSGKLFGIRYQMERGDFLPLHSHEEETLHNVIALDGDVTLVMNGADCPIQRGNVVDFDGSVKHTVRCDSSSATILNMFLNGIPDGYSDLPANEYEGTLRGDKP